MKISILLSFVLLIGYSNLPVRGQETIGREEYQIYSAALTALNYLPPNKQILIVDRTISLSAPLTLMHDIDSDPKFERMFDDLEDFEPLDENPVRLFAQFDLKDYQIVYDDELRGLSAMLTSRDDSSLWETLNAKYPNLAGLVSFSRIAFDSKKRRGVVYVMMTSGPRSGQAEYVSLKKKRNGWSFNDRFPMFRSPN